MLEIRDQRLILCVGPLDTSQSSHQHMSVLYPRSGKSYPESTPTVTALLELSDTQTFGRYLVVLALVAELTTVTMPKVTDRLAVWDENRDSFDSPHIVVGIGLRRVRTETGGSPPTTHSPTHHHHHLPPPLSHLPSPHSHHLARVL